MRRLHVTVSPEHRDEFERSLADRVPALERRFGGRWDVSFSAQHAFTDTIAGSPGGGPFRDGQGRLLFRPAGHGALIANLEETGGDLVFLKNIDNVAVSRLKRDTERWSRALVDLSGSGFTVMSARVDFIKKTSSVTSAGTEAVNGYQTTKYAIDTTAANSSDKRTFETMFGSGSYEKGTIWTTQEGCPVKLILAEARKQSSGNVDNFHFELAMVKK